MFDAHAHLQDERFDACRAAVLAAAVQAGVRGVCSCGSSPADWARLADLAAPVRTAECGMRNGETEAPIPELMIPRSALRIPHSALFVLPAFGVHPWYAGPLPPDWRERLGDLLARHPDAPVGEIGLDGLRDDPPREAQRAVLLAQLELAVRLGRPVVLHGARAWGELLEALRPFAPRLPGFVAHAFGGSEDLLRQVAALGGCVSFAGPACNPAARRVRAAAAAAPAARLLIETDAPDMAPRAERGVPRAECGVRSAAGGVPADLNHPANLVAVCRAVAELRGVPFEEIAALTAANARRVYRLGAEATPRPGG
jgi:TatD DNase family protein